MNQQRYDIVRLLGKGRTGGVYEATDNVLGRSVAMRRFFDSDGEVNFNSWDSTFVEITSKLTSIDHSGVLTIFDAGIDEDGAYIISQMLDAIPVQEQIFKGPFDKVTFHKGIKEMFQAFEAVHEAGLIHGALNTSSFMWLENPIKGSRYILVDLLHDRLAPLIQGESSSLAWMAEPTLTPVELYSEEAPTVQSDLFMLGQLIYTCLIGGHPFGGMSREQAKDAHLNTPIKPLHKYSLNISEAFSDWVATLYRKNPQDRPNSVREALDAMPPFIGKDGHKALIENHTSQNSTATEQLVQVGEPPKAHLPEKITNQLPITTTIEPTSPSHVTANLSSNRPTNKSGKFSPDSKHITILLICAAVILAIIASLLLISN